MEDIFICVYFFILVPLNCSMIDQHTSLSEKFLKKGLWLYVFSFIIAPMGYVIKIIISGDVSVSDLWILYGIISLITLLSSFNDFGMTESMSYFIPKYSEKKQYSHVKTIVAYAFITQVTTGTIIAWILFFGSDFLAIHYFKSLQAAEVLRIICLFFLWINIFQVFNNFFLAVQNTLYSRITDFLRMLFIMISVIFISIFEQGNITNFALAWVVWLYFWILFVVYFFYTKYYKRYFYDIAFCFSWKFFSQIFKYAILVFLAAQAATILSQMDMQMIIFFLGTTDAWYYTNYLSIITIPFLVIWPIFWLLFPVFSELHAKRQTQKIKLVKQILQKNFIAIAITINILFFVFAEIIAYILFWPDYITSWKILQYSIPFLTFNFLLQINFNILAGIWKVKERLRIIVVAIIFNFIANILLIQSFGVYGAALATSLGWILIWILSEFQLWHKYFSHFDYLFLWKNICCMWIIWIVSYLFLIPLFINLSRIESFFLITGITIIWIIAFWVLNYYECRKFIKEILLLRKHQNTH